MSEHSIGMRIARADKEDLEAAFDLYKLLNAIESGSFPPGEDEDDGEWNDFDERNRDDLLKFYETCMDIFSRCPSAIMRVLFAASCALDERNKLFDPAQDHLAHHPSIIETKKERDELLAALQIAADVADGVIHEELDGRKYAAEWREKLQPALLVLEACTAAAKAGAV